MDWASEERVGGDGGGRWAAGVGGVAATPSTSDWLLLLIGFDFPIHCSTYFSIYIFTLDH